MKRTVWQNRWRLPVSDAEAYRRAGGRRYYNSMRQFRAKLRRARVAELLRKGYRQIEIARELGVSKATICRDVAALAEEAQRERVCPVCGRWHGD